MPWNLLNLLVNTSITSFFKSSAELPINVLHICLILALAWLVHFLAHRVLRTLREYMARRAASTDEGKRVETLGRVAKHLLTLVISVIAGMLMLSALGIWLPFTSRLNFISHNVRFSCELS